MRDWRYLVSTSHLTLSFPVFMLGGDCRDRLWHHITDCFLSLGGFFFLSIKFFFSFTPSLPTLWTHTHSYSYMYTHMHTQHIHSHPHPHLFLTNSSTFKQSLIYLIFKKMVSDIIFLPPFFPLSRLITCPFFISVEHCLMLQLTLGSLLPLTIILFES